MLAIVLNGKIVAYPDKDSAESLQRAHPGSELKEITRAEAQKDFTDRFPNWID